MEQTRENETEKVEQPKKNKIEKPGNPWLIIKGKKYNLRFDTQALEQIEKEFGGVRGMFERLRGRVEGVSLSDTMRTVFRILGNSALDNEGLAMSLTGDEARHVYVGELTSAVKAAVNIGMHSETSGGNEADDETHDGYEEEYNEKNA